MDALKKLISEAADDGTSAGKLLSEYVQDMLDDETPPDTIAADMDAVIELASLIKAAAEVA